jgi:hypothetical protein
MFQTIIKFCWIIYLIRKLYIFNIFNQFLFNFFVFNSLKKISWPLLNQNFESVPQDGRVLIAATTWMFLFMKILCAFFSTLDKMEFISPRVRTSKRICNIIKTIKNNNNNKILIFWRKKKFLTILLLTFFFAHFFRKMIDLQHHHNCTTLPHMRVGPSV